MSAGGSRRLQVLDIVEDGSGISLAPRDEIADRPGDLAALATRAGAVAVVVWDADLPLPATELLHRLLQGPCHVWHAGLLLGQVGEPDAWNLCHGRSMFSHDVDPSIASTSSPSASRRKLASHACVPCLAHCRTTSPIALRSNACRSPSEVSIPTRSPR